MTTTTKPSTAQDQNFCERCKASGVDLQSSFEPSTLGRSLWFLVCHDEAACRERVLAKQAGRVRPPARISDLYPE